MVKMQTDLTICLNNKSMDMLSSNTNTSDAHTASMQNISDGEIANTVTLEQGSSLIASINCVVDYEDTQLLFSELMQTTGEVANIITDIASAFEECDGILSSGIEAQFAIAEPVPTPAPTPTPIPEN